MGVGELAVSADVSRGPILIHDFSSCKYPEISICDCVCVCVCVLVIFKRNNRCPTFLGVSFGLLFVLGPE